MLVASKIFPSVKVRRMNVAVTSTSHQAGERGGGVATTQPMTPLVRAQLEETLTPQQLSSQYSSHHYETKNPRPITSNNQPQSHGQQPCLASQPPLLSASRPSLKLPSQPSGTSSNCLTLPTSGASSRRASGSRVRRPRLTLSNGRSRMGLCWT